MKVRGAFSFSLEME